ncbi:PAS domain S-box protein [Mariprofundus sp. EBB-1]|uniref:hybrid sensor histidine kinase/response regulator n=1 Tax=Mariprofundus sp. EBB-1 TaxID=2650971 RepID=UPI00137955A7|nr:PAS domain S-box protein [Mariprofundus sp. EBB-1]
MNISQFKPVMKLLAVVMGSELLIMIGFQLLPASVPPEWVNLLDVLLLGLITTAVAQLWIVRPLQQAREQDALFRCVAEHSHAGLVITDPTQNHAIIFTNDAFTDITGYCLDEVRGKDPIFLSEGLGFQLGQSKIINALNEIKPVNAILKNKRKDGTEFWNDMHLSPISIGGEPRYWLGLLHDVTETRALNLQIEHLVSAVEQADDMICIFDKQGCIDFVNHAFTEQMGLDKEQLKGALIWHYWSDEAWSAERVQNVLKEYGQWSGRNQWSRDKQGPYAAMTTISMVEGDDGEQMYLAVIRDMTESIEMETKLAHAHKMEAVGTLAGGIAHDFNNMLAAMMGNLYLLKKNMLENDNAVRRIEAIEEQGYRGADLIRQMLVFARKQTLDRHDFDLQILGKETVKLLQTRTPENISLHTDIDPVKMMLHGDPSLLQSSLFNLVNNAIQAIEEVQEQTECSGIVNLSIYAVDMESLSPEVKVALAASDNEAAEQCVHISVSDNGSGMDENTRERIFEPYFTTKVQGKGTGLGMSMVMGCVEIHNGWIGLTSAPGKGSSFDIYLPMSCTAVESVVSHDIEMHPGHGELILLADDNTTLCESMREMLEDAGYQVLIAYDGEQALQLYMEQKDRVKMVILDCVMPKLGGAEVAETIWLYSGDSVKVVLMTGYDLGDSLTQKGISGRRPLVLHKPWNMEQLNGVLKSMCEAVD